MEHEAVKMKYQDIIEVPVGIAFEKRHLRLISGAGVSTDIRYEEIASGYLQVYDRNRRVYWRPKARAVKKEMEGYLVLYDIWKKRYEIHTFRLPKQAGVIFIQLEKYIPGVLQRGKGK